MRTTMRYPVPPMSIRRLLKVPKTPKKKGMEPSTTPPKVKKSRKRPLDAFWLEFRGMWVFLYRSSEMDGLVDIGFGDCS